MACLPLRPNCGPLPNCCNTPIATVRKLLAAPSGRPVGGRGECHVQSARHFCPVRTRQKFQTVWYIGVAEQQDRICNPRYPPARTAGIRRKAEWELLSRDHFDRGRFKRRHRFFLGRRLTCEQNRNAHERRSIHTRLLRNNAVGTYTKICTSLWTELISYTWRLRRHPHYRRRPCEIPIAWTRCIAYTIKLTNVRMGPAQPP